MIFLKKMTQIACINPSTERLGNYGTLAYILDP